MAHDPTIHHFIALGFATGAPAAPPKRGRRTPSLAIGGDSADYISLLKLAEHVGRSLGPQLATLRFGRNGSPGRSSFECAG